MGDFSHLSKAHKATMVDTSCKEATLRKAKVEGNVTVSQKCSTLLLPEMVAEICTTARIAGIQASKQTALLVPLCHQIPLKKVDISIEFDFERCFFSIQAETTTRSDTGVEIEAFIAAQISATTIYDMIKAVDPLAQLGPFRLNSKSGGKHLINMSKNLY